MHLCASVAAAIVEFIVRWIRSARHNSSFIGALERTLNVCSCPHSDAHSAGPYTIYCTLVNREVYVNGSDGRNGDSGESTDRWAARHMSPGGDISSASNVCAPQYICGVLVNWARVRFAKKPRVFWNEFGTCISTSSGKSAQFAVRRIPQMRMRSHNHGSHHSPLSSQIQCSILGILISPLW